MPRAYARVMRIAELVKREISNLLMTFNEDPRIAQTVVTDARLKHQSSRVKIYVYPAAHSSREEMLAGLNAHKVQLRKQLGARLDMRYVPDIEFVYDEAIDTSQRIEDALTQLREEDLGKTN